MEIIVKCIQFSYGEKGKAGAESFFYELLVFYAYIGIINCVVNKLLCVDTLFYVYTMSR